MTTEASRAVIRAWWVFPADDPDDGVVWLNEPTPEALAWVSQHARRQMEVAALAQFCPAPAKAKEAADEAR